MWYSRRQFVFPCVVITRDVTRSLTYLDRVADEGLVSAALRLDVCAQAAARRHRFDRVNSVRNRFVERLLESFEHLSFGSGFLGAHPLDHHDVPRILKSFAKTPDFGDIRDKTGTPVYFSFSRGRGGRGMRIRGIALVITASTNMTTDVNLRRA